MTAQALVCLFSGLSGCLLFATFLFASRGVGAEIDTEAMRRTIGAFRGGAGGFLRRHRGKIAAVLGLLAPTCVYAQPEKGGGEANLVLPDLSSVNFFGMTGHNLLTIGLLFCAGGLLFGIAIYVQLKNLAVHQHDA